MFFMGTFDELLIQTQPVSHMIHHSHDLQYVSHMTKSPISHMITNKSFEFNLLCVLLIEGRRSTQCIIINLQKFTTEKCFRGTYIHVYIHTCVHKPICMYVHVRMYIHMYMNSICTYIHTYIHSLNVHPYTYMYT